MQLHDAIQFFLFKCVLAVLHLSTRQDCTTHCAGSKFRLDHSWLSTLSAKFGCETLICYLYWLRRTLNVTLASCCLNRELLWNRMFSHGHEGVPLTLVETLSFALFFVKWLHLLGGGGSSCDEIGGLRWMRSSFWQTTTLLNANSVGRGFLICYGILLFDYGTCTWLPPLSRMRGWNEGFWLWVVMRRN